jgi:SAM-dependent methyltransferase
MYRCFRLTSCFLMVSFFGLNADAHLDRLFECDRHTCANILQAAELSDLWDYFLKGQADLYFSQESDILNTEKGWREAKAVLELGSGNGAYLHRISETFIDKTYLGVEKQPVLVKQSIAQFGRAALAFVEGDAEVENVQYNDQFDIVLFRLTLQYLWNPKHALQLAHQYLKPNGYVIIIESFDPARASSHEVRSIEEAIRQRNQQNQFTSRGNRRISIEVLEDLQNGNSLLGSLYEVARTSLDRQGNHLEKGIRFESEQDRKRFFNHALLHLGIFQKDYGIPVDFERIYEELQVYLENKESWVCPGMHFLVLKKI